MACTSSSLLQSRGTLFQEACLVDRSPWFLSVEWGAGMDRIETGRLWLKVGRMEAAAACSLLTTYLSEKEEMNLSDSKVEFNRRRFATTTIVLKAMARFKDTWEYLLGATWHSDNLNKLTLIIYEC
ncbi:hypothetical protein BRADI_5g01055v3 [Brachypodium distachyon]|uniref:Uncharacterized protein n=1 Tax=Brachypodium distachyon TaxID=15368 RepID=A0A2K2CER4_BRADI|nr:hypothetical protein BRADI_5g01055v3 [Brachypodium distachyon]